MIDALSQALVLPGLAWLALAAFAGGLTRGFAGFGTAMIFIPVASLFLTPVAAITVMVVTDILGPAPLIKRAWRDADRPELSRLAFGALFGVPLGTFALTALDPLAFRWAVSLICFALLALLVSGWRYNGAPGVRFVLALGFAAGFMGGLAGLPGPLVILFYLSGRREISVIRGVSLLFLFGTDILLVGTFLLRDLLATDYIVVGLICALPLAVGATVGQHLFRPEKAKLFRFIAYALIATAALAGLPLFDGATF